MYAFFLYKYAIKRKQLLTLSFWHRQAYQLTYWHSHTDSLPWVPPWVGDFQTWPLQGILLRPVRKQTSSVACCALSCPTLCSPTHPPGSSVLGIFQARILEWVAISYSSRGPQDRKKLLDYLAWPPYLQSGKAKLGARKWPAGHP